MKYSLVAFSLLVFGLTAKADLGETHQGNCETPEVKSLMGETGTCRIVITRKPVKKMGVCSGMFAGKLPCHVTYFSTIAGSGMNLTCGEDLGNPAINQDMPAEAVGYNVASIVTTKEGKTIVQNDSTEYSYFASSMLMLRPLRRNAQILIQLEQGPVALTGVRCQ